MYWLWYVVGVVIFILFLLFTRWQQVNKRGPNDAISVLHVSTVTWTILVLLFSVLGTTGYVWAEPLFLPAIVGTYVGIDFMYSLVSTLADRHKIRVLEEDDTVDDPYTRIGKRYGQYIGTVFVVVSILLVLLAALEVPAPFGEGRFLEVPEATYVAIEATVFIIAAASVAKILVGKTARIMHNNILFFVSVYSTVIFVALLVIEAMGGKEVPSDYPWVYLFALASYAGHNVALSLWCKGVRQERPGHLVGLFALAIFSPFLVVLYGFYAVPEFPHLMAAFALFTAIVMALGGSSRYLLEEWQDIKLRKESKLEKESDNINK